MRTSPNFGSGKPARTKKPLSFPPSANAGSVPQQSSGEKVRDDLEERINQIRTKSPAEIASLLEQWLQNEKD